MRNRKALQEQNTALDKKASDFVDKNNGRGRAREGGAATKRGLSADPGALRSKPKKKPAKHKVKIVEVEMAPAKKVEARSSVNRQLTDVVTLFIAPPKPKRNPTEHFRTVVQTKVHALNAFKRGIMGKQNIEDDDVDDDEDSLASSQNNNSSSTGSILKRSSQDALSRCKRVSFVNLPNRDQLSEPDLSERARAAEGSNGSSFDSTRSISDESVLLAST